MKMTNRKRFLSLILCVVLTWTVALITVGCTDKTPETPVVTTDAIITDAATEGTADVTKLGEGATSFTFTVTDKDGKETVFEISTDKTTVGDALTELGLIEGEDGDFGLYVKKVDGITADYNTDGTYWAFYVNGEYAMSGVDTTNIENGAVYAFKVEK